MMIQPYSLSYFCNSAETADKIDIVFFNDSGYLERIGDIVDYLSSIEEDIGFRGYITYVFAINDFHTDAFYSIEPFINEIKFILEDFKK